MPDNASNWIVEHRRRTRKEAKKILLWVALIFPIFLSVGLFILLRLGDRWFAYPWFGILAVTTLAQLLIARVNWKADGEFVCRLSTEWLECHCPAMGMGETFRIAISEIDELEETRDDHPRWYLWDKAGRRYWLTSNYGNPHDEIVQKIRVLRLELQD